MCGEMLSVVGGCCCVWRDVPSPISKGHHQICYLHMVNPNYTFFFLHVKFGDAVPYFCID